MTMPPSTTAWKLARYVGDMKDPDAPSRFWAECDPSDPELPDFEYRWLAASPSPEPDSQPEDVADLIERFSGDWYRLTDAKTRREFAELHITRLAQERDAMQGDFNDCNSERARWRRVAERCETEKQAAEKERDAVRNAMAESCSELSGAPCPRAEAAEKERDEALGEFARAGMRQADQLLAARSRAEAAEQALNETYTDESGTVWTRPTAWAYYAVCRARDAKARAHTAAEQALAAEQARTIEWRERAHAGLANLAAREEELRRKTEALELIVHTYTEDSHGNMKTMPADYYQKLARTALQERTDNG